MTHSSRQHRAADLPISFVRYSTSRYRARCSIRMTPTLGKSRVSGFGTDADNSSFDDKNPSEKSAARMTCTGIDLARYIEEKPSVNASKHRIPNKYIPSLSETVQPHLIDLFSLCRNTTPLHGGDAGQLENSDCRPTDMPLSVPAPFPRGGAIFAQRRHRLAYAGNAVLVIGEVRECGKSTGAPAYTDRLPRLSAILAFRYCSISASTNRVLTPILKGVGNAAS